MFFAAAILVDGAFNIVGSIQNREKDGWWVMLLIGILGVGVGGYALMNPPISMLAFVYLVALQAILLGVFLVMLGYRVRQATSREWLLYVTGALSVLFGILVLARPGAGQPDHRVLDRRMGDRHRRAQARLCIPDPQAAG